MIYISVDKTKMDLFKFGFLLSKEQTEMGKKCSGSEESKQNMKWKKQKCQYSSKWKNDFPWLDYKENNFYVLYHFTMIFIISSVQMNLGPVQPTSYRTNYLKNCWTLYKETSPDHWHRMCSQLWLDYQINSLSYLANYMSNNDLNGCSHRCTEHLSAVICW